MKKIIRTKQKTDLIAKSVIFFFSTLGIIALILMSFFIIVEAFPAYKKYGIFHMYFTADFSPKGNFGIWSALFITLLSSISAVAISLPLSFRTAIFIKFRVNKSKKIWQTIIAILAGVPSVVFGIFAIKSLSTFSSLLGSKSSYTLINSIFMLSIMLFPTLTSLIYNQLKLVDHDLIESSIALGNTKTHSIYKVVKKSIKPGVYVAIITALGRAIGETMALSMILSAPSAPLQGSFDEVLNAPYASLGVEISRRMFQDGSNPSIRSALFAAGIALFIIIMILVAIITKISNSKKIKPVNPLNYKQFVKEKYYNRWLYLTHIVIHSILLPFKIISFCLVVLFKRLSEFWQYILIVLMKPYWFFIYPKKSLINNKRKYFKTVATSFKIHINDYMRYFLEVVSITIVLGSSLWIMFDVLIIGVQKWRMQDWLFSYENDAHKMIAGDIMNPLIWTIILIEITILIALPFSLGTALFLSEYARNKKSGAVVKFFLDSLGGTPSILFGIFGVIFFLDTMGFQKQLGTTSLLAGSFTMVLVILPTFTRSIEQVLIKIPDSLRIGSYALGASKFETIKKIIIPQALPGIASGIVLSVGRIVSETAPIYLTLGMFAGTNIGPLEPGHTLTTDILNNQVFSSLNLHDALNQSYKLASVSMILVSIIVLITNFIDSPKSIKHKKVRVNNVKNN